MNEHLKRPDSAGRPQYVRKSTPAEIDRRNRWIAKLYHRGHNTIEIANALGVSDDVVRERLRASDPNRGRRYKGRGPVAEHCPWRDEDVPVHERERVIPPGAHESRS